ncbi:hypothetical protein ACET3Z_026225 [Daucus carota]
MEVLCIQVHNKKILSKDPLREVYSSVLFPSIYCMILPGRLLGLLEDYLGDFTLLWQFLALVICVSVNNRVGSWRSNLCFSLHRVWKIILVI